MKAVYRINLLNPSTLKHPEDYSEYLSSFIKECLIKEVEKRPSMKRLRNHYFVADFIDKQEMVVQIFRKKIYKFKDILETVQKENVNNMKKLQKQCLESSKFYVCIFFNLYILFFFYNIYINYVNNFYYCSCLLLL